MTRPKAAPDRRVSLERAMKKDKFSHWYLLIPDQLIWLGVAFILSPPVYSIYLFKHHKIGLAIMIFIVWLPLYAWFLKYLHSRRTARLPFTIVFSIFIITLGSAAVYYW